jgi:hypothetical protein
MMKSILILLSGKSGWTSLLSRAIHTVRFKRLDAQRAGAGNAAGKLWVSV